MRWWEPLVMKWVVPLWYVIVAWFQSEPFNEEMETVKQMVTTYMYVVSKTIQDIVPKYIVFHLVKNVSATVMECRHVTCFKRRTYIEMQ